MSPHLVKWDKTLRNKGLTVIDINHGNNDTKKALAAYVKKNKKEYPTLWDKDGRVCKEFGIKGYPAAFLIGADGKVVWEGWPNPELKDLPKLIAKEIRKADKMRRAQKVKTGDAPSNADLAKKAAQAKRAEQARRARQQAQRQQKVRVKK